MTPEGAAAAPAAAPPGAPRLRRLKKRAEFLFVAQGLAAARGAVLVQARPRAAPLEVGQERLPEIGPDIGEGFTATRKIGGAVVRNRAKRRLRECALLLLPLYGRAGHDYVFVARTGAPTRPWDRLVDDVKGALISLAAGGDAPRPPRSPRPAAPRPPAAARRPAAAGRP